LRYADPVADGRKVLAIVCLVSEPSRHDGGSLAIGVPDVVPLAMLRDDPRRHERSVFACVDDYSRRVERGSPTRIPA
jgi:hypothetical protein